MDTQRAHKPLSLLLIPLAFALVVLLAAGGGADAHGITSPLPRVHKRANYPHNRYPGEEGELARPSKRNFDEFDTKDNNWPEYKVGAKDYHEEDSPYRPYLYRSRPSGSYKKRGERLGASRLGKKYLDNFKRTAPMYKDGSCVKSDTYVGTEGPQNGYKCRTECDCDGWRACSWAGYCMGNRYRESDSCTDPTYTTVERSQISGAGKYINPCETDCDCNGTRRCQKVDYNDGFLITSWNGCYDY